MLEILSKLKKKKTPHTIGFSKYHQSPKPWRPRMQTLTWKSHSLDLQCWLTYWELMWLVQGHTYLLLFIACPTNRKNTCPICPIALSANRYWCLWIKMGTLKCFYPILLFSILVPLWFHDFSRCGFGLGQSEGQWGWAGPGPALWILNLSCMLYSCWLLYKCVEGNFCIINYPRLTLTALHINEKCLRTNAMCLLGACPGLPEIEFWTCGLISLAVWP